MQLLNFIYRNINDNRLTALALNLLSVTDAFHFKT